MRPITRPNAAPDAELTPLLFWNEITAGGGGAPLACPQCAGANLHLDTIYFATPTEDHYTPTVGLRIHPDTGAAIANDQARQLHAGQNRGPMLTVAYWCENGCRGRVEFRQHKGHLFASLHDEPPLLDHEDDDASEETGQLPDHGHHAEAGNGRPDSRHQPHPTR
jgi:hypothetical protein